MRGELGAQSVAVSTSTRGLDARLLSGFGMAASRGAGVVLQFLVQVAVGSLAGPAGLGILQLFTSWSCILGEALALGLPARVMRTTAVTWSRGDAAATQATMDAAARLVLKLSAGVVAGVGLLTWAANQLWPGLGAVDAGLVLLAAVLAAPLFALLRLGADGLKGMNSPLAAISLENLLLPLVVLAACALWWQSSYPVTAVALLLAGMAGLALTALGLWRMLERRLPATGRAASVPTLRLDADLAALWGSGVLGIAFLHLPFLVLPWYAGTDEVGIYAVAHKLVNIVTTLLILMAAVFGPAFARAAADQNRARLRSLLWHSQWLSLVIFVPMVVLILFGVDQLAALFNVPPHNLETFLLALAAGQLINAATGLPGVLLNMAGRAGWELRTLLVSLLLTALAAPAVGEQHGAVGLAWLFSAALAFKNLASLGLAYIYLQRVGTTT